MASKARVVLVGCGGIAGAWMNTETTKKKVKIVGLVDIKKSNIKRFAERWELRDAVMGTDLSKVLHETNPDAVFDCTIPEAHCEVTLTALKHGSHVLGEKPMADTLANAKKMVNAAKKSGKIYSVIQNRRYQKEIRALRKFIENGGIGKVCSVHSDFFLGIHFGGFRDRMKHVLILDMAIHTFDAARFISGADATSVYCQESNPSYSWYDHDASASAIFEMTDDIVYTYQGSWAALGCSTSWNCDWRITGSKGTILWDGNQNFKVELVDPKKSGGQKPKSVKIPVRCPKKLAQGHNGLISAFLDAIRNNTETDTICTDNIKSIAMVHGAVQSSETGRKINIKL